MILNDKDCAKAEVRIRKLKGMLDLLQRRFARPHEALSAKIQYDRIENRITELSLQRQRYLNLLMQNVSIELPSNLSEIPDYLIQRRIRLGLRQEELAKLLGFERRTINRYERTAYSGASFSRILEIDFLLRNLELKRV